MATMFDFATLATSDLPLMSLRESRRAWLHLQAGLRELDSVSSRAALCRSCDSLHEHFDQLTLLYEKSLQLLMS